MKPQYFEDEGVLHSVLPAETHFGFSPWALMVPPFKPERMLILGYGAGTVAALTHKIWGDVNIIGVDLVKASEEYCTIFHQSGAHEFLKGQMLSGTGNSDINIYAQDYFVKYDYIVIDLFNGSKIPDMVFSAEFVESLKNVGSKMISINTFSPFNTEIAREYEKTFEQYVVKKLFGNEVRFYILKGDNNVYHV